MEGALIMKCKNILTKFSWGIIVGFLFAVIIFGTITGLVYVNYKNKELLHYAERQIEIEVLREDYINRDPVEFLEVPGVCRAVDGASDEFIRKRDEILHRFRDRLAD
jgi:hypothetical protein